MISSKQHLRVIGFGSQIQKYAKIITAKMSLCVLIIYASILVKC